ncbi:hypothetical protein FZC84_21205 [Rossellomorea vietnamensis]|uniref:Uncharacterized protein n=1 Tax=Rossellomorea vietnamensis TaxID=218284 RepID=A0A5D4M351_9BACI|nr:hypothetical protein [Rossellomorea vietnamensis]TYR95713.1 hypothetical protein FZC84_21205 [Rossellomorea vietnamensis]
MKSFNLEETIKKKAPNFYEKAKFKLMLEPVIRYNNEEMGSSFLMVVLGYFTSEEFVEVVEELKENGIVWM